MFYYQIAVHVVMSITICQGGINKKKMYDISFICFNRCGRMIYPEFGVYTELLEIATAVR